MENRSIEIEIENSRGQIVIAFPLVFDPDRMEAIIREAFANALNYAIARIGEDLKRNLEILQERASSPHNMRMEPIFPGRLINSECSFRSHAFTDLDFNAVEVAVRNEEFQIEGPLERLDDRFDDIEAILAELKKQKRIE